MTKLEDQSDDEVDLGADGSMAQLSNGDGRQSNTVQATELASNAQEIDNIIQDEMVDINRFRYQNKMSNIIYSTCPIIPKYHTTFGEPIERQEISSEFE